MRELGQKLRELREGRGWSQSDLAKRAGVTKSAISTYEQGIRTPSADVLCAFAKAFGVSADYLLGISQCRTLDLSGLSEVNEGLVRDLVGALRQQD